MEKVYGIAVECTERAFRLPSLDLLPSSLYPQNLPSILAVQALDPTPDALVLDMCASPGGKTMHLAARMRNTGCIIAFDKNAKKVTALQENLAKSAVTNTVCFVRNSAKVFHPDGIRDLPSFIGSNGRKMLGPSIFDMILLDPPCSGFGQRPELGSIGPFDFEEHASYQKCLFGTAHALLKPGGYLLYSTCSISVQENEELVSEMLTRYPDLSLVTLPYSLAPGNPGFTVPGLTEDQAQNVRRFLPIESVGFFFAKFRKQCL